MDRALPRMFFRPALVELRTSVAIRSLKVQERVNGKACFSRNLRCIEFPCILAISNMPRSIYQYSHMAMRLEYCFV